MTATPWQVRYVRWWYERQVAWYAEMARRGRNREYNLLRAAEDAETVPRIRAHWLETGRIPLVIVDRRVALERLRVPPRLSMLRSYDAWITAPKTLPARARAVAKQRRTTWMFSSRRSKS